jgi:hypothetical protein
MQTIYHQITGEAKILESVDAREHIATGRWGYTRPQSKIPDEHTEETYLDEFNQNGDNDDNQTEDNLPGHEADLGGQGSDSKLDPTSQEAYDQRQDLFNQSKSEAEVAASEVIDEIAKSKKSRK